MNSSLVSRSAYVPVVGVALLAVALLGWQHQRHQTEIQAIEAQLQPGRAQSANRVSPNENAAAGRAAASKGSHGATHPTSLRDILAQVEPAARLRALLAYADDVPTAEIAAAVQLLRASSPDWDPDTRAAIHLLLTRWAREAPEQALASLRTLDPTKNGGDATSILAGIAASDPERATKWLSDPDNRMTSFPFLGQFLAGSIGKEWARQNSAAALEWASKLPDNQRTGAYVGILGTLAGSDPATASAQVTRLEDGSARREAIRHIATVWGKQDPQAAADWAQSLTGEERTVALKETLSSWAGHQPAAAAKYLETLKAEEITADQLKAVTEPWVSQAPASAAAWLVARPDGDAKNEAMSSVMWRWTTAEPSAASAWLRAQPTGPARDSGVAGLALATFDSDPPSALTWAASITDENKRTGALKIGITEWLKRDPTAAKEWAASNNLPVP